VVEAVTAYALHLARDKAVLASDTCAYVPSGQVMGSLSKVFPQAHLGGVLFGRGTVQILAETACIVGQMPQLDSIEAAAEALPGVLRAVARRYQRNTATVEGVTLAEVLLLGWSECDKRMKLHYWTDTDDWQPCVVDGGAPRLLALPQLPADLMPARKGSLDRQLVEVMQAHRRHFGPETGVIVGGEVQRWTIDRTGISVRTIHRLADQPPVTAAAA
jgi:hypothetical protein